MNDALSSTWENAGGRPREWRRLELRHLQPVRPSQEVWLSVNKSSAEVEDAIFCVQTFALAGLLDMAEERLFESLVRRPMRVATPVRERSDGEREWGLL